ncbi:MAG TPA: 2-succinyl-5-enolpyruvyl-6-hydroxy-3-cyclohexene-1-carboxylic-acid synthase [Solirubrobacteraceae bacterium]|jgi:2-succinyl-5-enolpyruvyl-6-hydroxy-3-cyclohexene-1-carboxylate synthase|nr:2-succinyl-5-enolpyruvyl-6-hydroxy-3-cyclohexene-1-carboxylic-acid synthase [Solirubrobacteraceae bacterium]
MTPTTDTHLLLRAFVDELARCGMRAACTSPGSRSAPLALSLAREPRLRCYSHIDERCSGFFALGLAKASGLPVAVTCTSGTAAAQLLAPAVEAREARVPLILLTADRPAELRDNGAGQAIDQLKMLGSAAKWFVEVELGGAGAERLPWIRTLACRAYATALEGRPGAVHLNFPLREPLLSEDEPPQDSSGRPGGAPFVSRATLSREPAKEDLAGLRSLLDAARRGVVIAGREERDSALGEAAEEFAQAAGWPLLADPLSGARRGECAVAHYDAILRDPPTAKTLQADLILRVGDLPVSKPLRSWLAEQSATTQIVLDPEGAWQDPDGVLTHSFALRPAATLARLAEQAVTADADWLARWRAADELAAEAVGGVVGESGLSEPRVAAELGALLPAEATLFVASSMPVRDIETFWPSRPDPPRVLCNRGANGIDGIVSSAFGAAAADDGPVVLLIGDVALAHDIGGLLAARRLGLKLTIVAIDNGGGGIFDFLPVSRVAAGRETDPSAETVAGEATEATDLYTRHVATPTGLHFAGAAALYGLAYERAEDTAGFRAALERAMAAPESTIVEVQTDRGENVKLHARVWEAVGAALSPSP